MDEKTLLTGVLTKTLNMTDEEVSELLYQKSEDSDDITLKDESLDLILDRDVKRIDNVKKNIKPDKTRLEGEYSRGVKESMEKFEQQLKQKYGIESSAQGLDLVQEAIDTVSECNLEITEDRVKAHPLYRALEENSVAREKYETLESEFTDFKSNQDRIARFGKIKSDALRLTSELNPIISENPTVAKTRQDDYLKKFEEYDYELKDDGNHFVMKDGKRVEDDHGNAIKFTDHVNRLASTYYEFRVSEDLGQAGNKSKSNGQTIKLPKDEKEYLATYADLRSKGLIEDATKLALAWEASKNK